MYKRKEITGIIEERLITIYPTLPAAVHQSVVIDKNPQKNLYLYRSCYHHTRWKLILLRCRMGTTIITFFINIMIIANSIENTNYCYII